MKLQTSKIATCSNKNKFTFKDLTLCIYYPLVAIAIVHFCPAEYVCDASLVLLLYHQEYPLLLQIRRKSRRSDFGFYTT